MKVIRKKLSKKKIFLVALFEVFFIVFLISSYKIVKYYIDKKKIDTVINEVIELTTIIESESEEAEEINPPEDKNSLYYEFINMPFASVDFTKLLQKNNETVAWLIVNNTNINYPIVQTNNNDFYLNHSFDRTYNGGGWLFMDYRNNPTNFDTNTIIYGHSLLTKTMFGSLLNARYEWWYTNKENQVIKLSTPSQNTLWQIFSIYKVTPENYYINNSFNSEEEIQKFFDKLLERSVYDFNVDLVPSDKILTLSTCNTANGDERLVVHAKMIKREQR